MRKVRATLPVAWGAGHREALRGWVSSTLGPGSSVRERWSCLLHPQFHFLQFQLPADPNILNGKFQR